jgi:hypothetical protein
MATAASTGVYSWMPSRRRLQISLLLQARERSPGSISACACETFRRQATAAAPRRERNFRTVLAPLADFVVIASQASPGSISACARETFRRRATAAAPRRSVMPGPSCRRLQISLLLQASGSGRYRLRASGEFAYSSLLLADFVVIASQRRSPNPIPLIGRESSHAEIILHPQGSARGERRACGPNALHLAELGRKRRGGSTSHPQKKESGGAAEGDRFIIFRWPTPWYGQNQDKWRSQSAGTGTPAADGDDRADRKTVQES